MIILFSPKNCSKKDQILRRYVNFGKILCGFNSSSYICHNYVHSRMHASIQGMSPHTGTHPTK